MNIQQQCIDVYAKHKHLKITGEKVGIPWQSVYIHLKKAGVQVTGDKERYGSDADKFACKSERDFLELIPFAKDMNRSEFQHKYDFEIGEFKVDLKAARPKSYTKNGSCRWSFSLKKQILIADFFVCFAYDNTPSIKHCLLIPSEVAKGYSSLSLSPNGARWWDYELSLEELKQFFEETTI